MIVRVQLHRKKGRKWQCCLFCVRRFGPSFSRIRSRLGPAFPWATESFIYTDYCSLSVFKNSSTLLPKETSSEYVHVSLSGQYIRSSIVSLYYVRNLSTYSCEILCRGKGQNRDCPVVLDYFVLRKESQKFIKPQM